MISTGYTNFKVIISLPRGDALVREDGELSARLWMGTYNPGDEGVNLDAATLIVIGADMFDG